MKREKKLLVLLAALVALISVTLLVGWLIAGSEKDADSAVFSLDPDKVTKIWWDYSDEAGFTKVGGSWVYDADAAFPVNEDCLAEMLRVLSSLSPSKTIENAKDLDQYGLLYPFCAIKVTMDGTEYQLAIGDQNTISGYRYLSTGDGNVYMVDNEIASYFAFGPEGAMALEEIPDLSGMTGLKVQSNIQNYEITYEVGSDKSYSSQHKWFMGNKALDTALTQNLLAVIKDLDWKECVNYNATDLAAYGLDAPKAVATAAYLDKTFTLELGDKCDKGVYARIADSKMVYIVKNEVLDKLLDTTYSELMPDEVLLMDWDTVTSMDIVLDGNTYTLTQESAQAAGNTTYVWKLGGAEVKGSNITQRLDDMATAGYATGLAPELDQQIRFVFYRNDTHHTQVELAMYGYDSECCLVTLDGVSTVLADRSDVMALMDEVKNIVLK